LVAQYRKSKRQINEYKGYLAEVFMSQVLWYAQRKILPGRLFHSDEDIEMPWRFIYVRQRMRFEAGEDKEVDVIGAAGGDYWVCQSKWWTQDKVGLQVLHGLEAQGEFVKENMEFISLRLWLFAYNGLTEEAEQYAKERGILWSSLSEFNELLHVVGLRQLPEL
jgi:hypothetical protein